MNRQHGVTYIDDLPDLNDLTEPTTTPHSQMVPDQDKYKKFIRNGTGNPAMESGMSRNKITVIDDNLMEDTQSYAQQQTQQYQQHSAQLYSCIDIANHIKTCPICSKLYNDDKTLYILCIILLCIVCIILIKKILNV
jgi:hypothetical protein